MGEPAGNENVKLARLNSLLVFALCALILVSLTTCGVAIQWRLVEEARIEAGARP